MSGVQIVTGGAVTETLMGVAIGRRLWLRMNRASIALAGAAVLIAMGAISRGQANHALDWHTIVLLVAMTVLNVNLRIAGFFHRMTIRVASLACTPRRLLARYIRIRWTLGGFPQRHARPDDDDTHGPRASAGVKNSISSPT